MIDSFQRLANRLWPLRIVAVGAGVLFLLLVVVIILFSNSREDGKYLIPGFLGILWSLSAHAFIINFQSVPEKAKRSDGFLHRLKRNVHRSWYWIIAFIFTGTTVAAVFFTFRLVSIWLNDYNG
jgi:hypothetical protein